MREVVGSPAARWFTALALFAACVPLTWACLSQFLMHRSAALDLPTAARRYGDADLLARAAQQEMTEATQEREIAGAVGLARRALLRGPMQSRALQVLALEADRRGEKQRANQLMDVSNVRTYRDTDAQLWLFERSLGRRDYEQAFLHVDVVLRRNRDLSSVLFPMIIESLGDTSALRALADRFSTSPVPDWRRGFLSALARDDGGVSRAADLFALLSAGRAPPSDAEASDLIAQILAREDYRLARRTWLRLLPQDAADTSTYIYDGGFAGAPGSAPFNWGLHDQGDALSELARSPDGRPALHLQYSAARRSELARQLLVLPPGVYRFSGAAQFGADEAPPQIGWSIVCVGKNGVVLAQGPDATAGPGWRPFMVDFEVPAGGCEAQWLTLASRAQDSFAVLDAWYETLAITRLGDVRPAVQATRQTP